MIEQLQRRAEEVLPFAPYVFRKPRALGYPLSVAEWRHRQAELTLEAAADDLCPGEQLRVDCTHAGLQAGVYVIGPAMRRVGAPNFPYLNPRSKIGKRRR